MKFIPAEIPDVIIIEPDVFGDERGFFMENWHKAKFRENGIDADFVQDNHSRSGRHALRGLHYQIKQPQGKLVRVVLGEVFDVAVDLRRASPTFGKWTGEYLSGENKKMLWVPPGFAHGFLVTSESADLLYKCTDFYAPEHERTLRWDDPELAIEWPLPEDVQPILSKKDAGALMFKDAEVYE
ncbi:MAG: dTDP-4-dehydrorhamnose 3,5-epimerase [Gammaproteobacteria bacterium]